MTAPPDDAQELARRCLRDLNLAYVATGEYRFAHAAECLLKTPQKRGRKRYDDSLHHYRMHLLLATTPGLSSYGAAGIVARHMPLGHCNNYRSIQVRLNQGYKANRDNLPKLSPEDLPKPIKDIPGVMADFAVLVLCSEKSGK